MKIMLLTQGKIALIDDSDFERLNQWKWQAVKHRGNFYAIRSSDRKPMHRLIMNTPDGMETDHVNQDTLDNRRSNLRVCTTRQNQHNRRKNKNSSCPFKGVSFIADENAYVAQICIDGKLTYLGYFKDPVEAARKYDEAATEHFGSFSRLNFPKGIQPGQLALI